ncbi:MAG: ATPase [Chromatiaceae bacterium]|nr:ATPase [Chromatiaceae bacterium]
MNQVDELERAILARAERLADEYRERARRSRDSILREASERLRLREAREESLARAQGERLYRQRVQASELKMQAHLDQMRWNLVQAVERRLAERMRAFSKDAARYEPWLDAIIAQSAAQIEHDSLILSANARDQHRLHERWEAVLALAPATQTLELTPAAGALDTLGGLRLASADGRIRIDQTFEGRLERLRPRLQQTILERLLPSGFDTSNLFVG